MLGADLTDRWTFECYRQNAAAKGTLETALFKEAEAAEKLRKAADAHAQLKAEQEAAEIATRTAESCAQRAAAVPFLSCILPRA